jgi:pimeloyl-ACP methyl ester carboxylesterase
LKSIDSTLSAAEAVTQPWLLIHGDADDVVPIQDGLDAFAAAICEKRWVEMAGAGHSFDEASYPKLVEAVDDWLTASFGAGF